MMAEPAGASTVAVSEADKQAVVEDVLLLQAKLAEMAEQVERVRKQNSAIGEENAILKKYLGPHTGPDKP
jgi:transposase-like protein